MKKIKIYALPSHQTEERTSGVDYARVISPMKFLNGYSDGEVTFEVTLYDITKPIESQDNWIEIAKNHDVVFLNYTVHDWAYAAMGFAVHGAGKKIIMELDDDIWDVSSDNIAHDKLKELNAGKMLTSMLNDVDGVVCTNRYLRNIITDKTYKTHDKILVAGNNIDFSLYKTTHPAKDTGSITLMHYGSTSHFNDLLLPEFVEGMDKILKEYPNVKFKTVGAFISELRYKWGMRYENDFGDVDIYKWINDKFPQFMEECDIMVVPLIDNKYNRAKSSIKWCESGSAMKPGIFSDVRPYSDDIEDGKTGYLVSTADEWYEKMKLLIESKELRQTIGQQAYTHIKEHRHQALNTPLYAEFIKKIVWGS